MINSTVKGILVGVALALASSPSAAALSKKIVRKIANQEITKRAPALRGQVGPAGPAGPVGSVGPVGPEGSVGSAAVQRYAHILPDGSVVPSRSFGITQDNVFLDGPNTYCFTGLPYISVGQVTLDYFQTPSNATAKFDRRSSDPECQVSVKVFNGPRSLVQGGFFIILY